MLLSISKCLLRLLSPVECVKFSSGDALKTHRVHILYLYPTFFRKPHPYNSDVKYNGLESLYYIHYLSTALDNAGYTIIKYSCQDKCKLSLSGMWIYNMHSAIWKADCMILIKIQSILLCRKSSILEQKKIMWWLGFDSSGAGQRGAGRKVKWVGQRWNQTAVSW